jgi:hypothetical protein
VCIAGSVGTKKGKVVAGDGNEGNVVVGFDNEAEGAMTAGLHLSKCSGAIFKGPGGMVVSGSLGGERFASLNESIIKMTIETINILHHAGWG